MSNKLLLGRLQGVKARFDEVGILITDPNTFSDMKKYIQLNKEYKLLEPIVEAYKQYKDLLSNIESAKEILSKEKDEEMREMAKAELEDLNLRIDPLEEKIKMLLLPSDPEDEKGAVVEI